ncbi:Ig-like domain-containing protein [candidate division CSSED10-310 bacterium]|uniref:Ig-like domain-containing protein n=1 Tax=candidate division CSSED10-310 bacterium TaxID=2855610 RepID=A0ABV6YVI1_UNCC1
MKYGHSLVIFIFLAVLSADLQGTEISIETLPPVVVETVPRAGNSSVDPSLKEIRVTFSKDMITEKMWSWVMISKDTFPKIVGEIKFLKDKRTCVAPVKLEKGKTYAIWFNSEKYNAFRDTTSKPAIPYLLVFQTRK